jgi:hypothetical protein
MGMKTRAKVSIVDASMCSGKAQTVYHTLQELTDTVRGAEIGRLTKALATRYLERAEALTNHARDMLERHREAVVRLQGG